MDTLELMRERKSTRAAFDPARPIGKKHLDRILEAARWTPTAHNMQNFEIMVIDDKEVIRQLGEIKSMVSEEFIRENFLQLCRSEEELRRKKVGIIGSQFPPKWQDASKLDEAVKERAPTPLSYTIRGGATLILVLYDTRKRAPGSGGDRLGFLSLGCLMENIWLMAESLGIHTHIMSAFCGAEVKAGLQEILGFPDHMEVAFAMKLGFPASAAGKSLRVRRDIPDFTYRNKYGKRY